MNASVSGGPIGIVVVNYASHEVIERNLGSIDLADAQAAVVIVDNFSSAAEADAARELADRHRWSHVALAGNRGFAAAVNIGVDRAIALGCKSFLILNPDATLSPAVIEELRVSCLADHWALISPVIDRPDGSVWFQGGAISLHEAGLRDPVREPPPDPQSWITAACLAVHLDLWAALGGIDEDYFLYWEDVDLSYRCAKAGGRLVMRPDLRAVHEVGATQPGQSGKSPVYYRYNCRNRLVFAAKHLSARDQLRWVWRTPTDVRRVLTRGGRRQLLKPFRVVGPGLAGVGGGLWWMATRSLRRTEVTARPVATPAEAPGAGNRNAAPLP